jgi:hypothetical protein
MPLPAPDFERLLVPGARYTSSYDMNFTIRLRNDASLWLPSGRIVAGEPFMYGAADYTDGFIQRVPPGRYPVELAIADFEAGEHIVPTVAAARLVIRDEPVASWEMALYEGQDLAELGDDEFFGYPVDGGTGGFIDAETIPTLTEDFDQYLENLMDILADRSADDDAKAVTMAGANSEPVMVAFSSGGGDGHYPTWIGRTADGEIVCVLTDFFILPDETEEEQQQAS